MIIRHWSMIATASAVILLLFWMHSNPLPASADDKKKATSGKAQEVELDGEAVYLGEALRKEHELELEDGALDGVVALRTSSGKLLPILPTESGLFFYSDERVRNRPMRVKVRTHPAFDGLEIIDRHSLVNGKANEIYYWCEICSIRMHHLKQCDCCQGPVELREHPVGERFRVNNK